MQLFLRVCSFTISDGKLTTKNVLVFNLHIKCEPNDADFKSLDDYHMAAPEKKYTHPKGLLHAVSFCEAMHR